MNTDVAAARVIARFRARRWTLATAESCTGGLLGATITSVPGSSEVYLGGWVTYANEMKQRELDVAPELFGPGGAGAVSREVAEAMARGGRDRCGASVCLSITGVAGPGGGTPEKPVGTVWMGLASPDRVESRLFVFDGDREQIRAAAVAAALQWLERGAAD